MLLWAQASDPQARHHAFFFIIITAESRTRRTSTHANSPINIINNPRSGRSAPPPPPTPANAQSRDLRNTLSACCSNAHLWLSRRICASLLLRGVAAVSVVLPLPAAVVGASGGGRARGGLVRAWERFVAAQGPRGVAVKYSSVRDLVKR